MTAKHILIVHPDPARSGLLASRLFRTGLFSVQSAHDGFEAASKLYGGDFNGLILCDPIPGLDPVRATCIIRESVELAEMVILVLSARTDAAWRHDLIAAGSDVLLKEPVNPAELVQEACRLMNVSPPQGKARRRATEIRERIAELRQGNLNAASDPVPDEPPEFDAKPEAEPEPTTSFTGVPPPTMDPNAPLKPGLLDEIWNMIGRGVDVPGLPPGASRLDDIQSGSLGDYLSKDLLAVDVSLAVAVLRMANSIRFAGFEPIDGLSRAVMRVGQREVSRQLINSYDVRSRIPEMSRNFLLGSFWRHSLMVACLAEEIAGHLRFRNFDAIFTAGLLHDIGRLFLVHHFPAAYQRVEDNKAIFNPTGGPLDISPLEREIIKIDHGLAGYELCRAWSLPPILQAGTLHHHLESDRTRTLAHARVALIVGIADQITQAMTLPHSESPADSEGVQAALEAFYEAMYQNLPAWAHKILKGRQMPLRNAYERASRRVRKAARKMGLDDQGPMSTGASPSTRKAG